MARYPSGEWRPLAKNWDDQPGLTRHNLVLLHTMVGSLDGTDRYFSGDGYGGSESHFGVGGEGRVFQWQDTAHRAEANGAANDQAISIETEDRNHRFFPLWDANGTDVPAWTDKQVDELARLVAWCCTTHGIPCQLVASSKEGVRGVGYHRLGVPRRRGDTVSQTGGELWSSAAGKSCPGDRRIAQIPKIIEKARRIMAGVSTQPKTLATPGGIVIPVLLPRTDPPAGPSVPSVDWPYREEIVNLGWVGGWRGRCMVRVSFGHPGGRIFRAHFDTPQGTGARVWHWPGIGDWPGLEVLGAYAEGREIICEAPQGPTSLMLTYAAPGGASLSVEWER